MGLLVLYHTTPYDWTDEELELAASFANQMATAVANARLYDSVSGLEARLRAIGELSSRLNRITTVDGIGEAIVTEADRLIDHDTIRVYRVDQERRMCEPIAFQGEFAGIGRPTLEQLRLPVGQGLTGWVAEHGRSLRIGDAGVDPRGVQVGETAGPESMLVVPMSFEDRVLGVIVVSKRGRNRFTEDDERTLTIFGGYAAQAMSNAGAFARLETQQAELAHRLESQRRLLEINEHLLSTLDPTDVLEKIADSLLTVVAYDNLTVYRADWSTGLRRAVVARDRFAELILQDEGPIEQGVTGWAIDAPRGAAGQRRPSRRTLGPDPGHAVRARVDGHLPAPRRRRRHRHAQRGPDGRRRGPLQPGRVRARPAVRGAGVDRPGQRRDPRRGHAPGRARRADRPAQPRRVPAGAGRRAAAGATDGRPFGLLMMDLDAFKAYNDRHGHPAGDALLHRIADAMRAAIRDGDRLYRYGGDEFAVLLPGAGRTGADRGRRADPRAGGRAHARRRDARDRRPWASPPSRGRPDQGRAGRLGRPGAVSSRSRRGAPTGTATRSATRISPPSTRRPSPC